MLHYTQYHELYTNKYADFELLSLLEYCKNLETTETLRHRYFATAGTCTTFHLVAHLAVDSSLLPKVTENVR